MPHLTVAFLGDVVGSPGRKAVAGAVPVLRAEHGVDIVIANGENARHGAGLSRENFRQLRDAGVDAVTLGDHCFADSRIVPALEHPESHVCRPANLSSLAPGKTRIRLTPRVGGPLYVLTVLGRTFMSRQADSPFDAIDRELGAIPEPDAMALVEIHAEATSEKQAVAWHCRQRWTSGEGPRVVAVVGSHTHVRTDDARILGGGLAAITDLGMCGAYESVIGRTVESTLRAMRVQDARPLELARRDLRAGGAIITIDTDGRCATAIRPVEIALDQNDSSPTDD